MGISHPFPAQALDKARAEARLEAAGAPEDVEAAQGAAADADYALVAAQSAALAPAAAPVVDALEATKPVVAAAVEKSSTQLAVAELETDVAEGLAPCANQIFNPTSMCAYSNVLTQALPPCFEKSLRAIDSSKNQPTR